jgi:hypothetical protein
MPNEEDRTESLAAALAACDRIERETGGMTGEEGAGDLGMIRAALRKQKLLLERCRSHVETAGQGSAKARGLLEEIDAALKDEPAAPEEDEPEPEPDNPVPGPSREPNGRLRK